MSPPFITKKMKLKEVKLLHQGHASDRVDLVKPFCGMSSFEATVDKASVCRSSHPNGCMHPEAFTEDSDQALNTISDGLCGSCSHFPKPRSPVCTGYSVMASFRKPQHLRSVTTDNPHPQTNGVYTTAINSCTYLVCYVL